MRKMKKVSVIIPVYNVEKYLRECLDSVVNQTYKNLQIIVVDDGSTDSSGKICDEYADKDNRITVIHQENAGAANAKNTGLDNVNGDYIAFIDSDDYVALDWIQVMVATLEEYSADIVECGLKKLYKDGTSVPFEINNCELAEYENTTFLKEYLYNQTGVIFLNKIYKADLIKDVRFKTERRCVDDAFFTYKVVSSAKKIIRISKALIYYRQRLSSAMHNADHNDQIIIDSLDVMLERYEWIKQKLPQLTREYLFHDIDYLLFMANNYSFSNASATKHRKLSKYYFKESMKHFPNRIALINSISLVKVKKDVLLKEKNAMIKVDKNRYFD